MKFLKYFLLTALIHGMGQCSHAETTDKTIYGNYPSRFYGLRNYVKNPDAEINTDGHAVSGSGATITTVANLDMFNKKQFRVGGNPGNTIVSTVAINTYDRALLDSGKTCITSYWLSISSNGIMTVNMKLDSTVVGTQTIDASLTGVESKRYYILHPCGNTLQVPSLEFSYAVTGGLSTNLFNYDDVHSGFYDGVSAVPQGSSFVGSLKYTNTPACVFSRSSTAWGNYSADTDCPTAIVKGVVTAPATKIPGLVLPAGSAPGRYVFTATGAFYKNGTSSNLAGYRFSDGTNNSAGQGVYADGATKVQSPVITGEITYTNALAAATTVQIQSRNGASISAEIDVASDSIPDLEIQVVYFPLSGSYTNVFPSSLADTYLTWTSGMTIGATTTPPTKGTTSNDRIGYALDGIGARIKGEYRQTGTGTTGSGDYLFTLPGGLEFADGTTYFTTLINNTATGFPSGIGSAMAGSSSNFFIGVVVPYDSTRFRIAVISDANTRGAVGSGMVGTASTGMFITFDFWAPMKGRIPNNGAHLGAGFATTDSTTYNLPIEVIQFAGNAGASANCTSSPCTIVSQLGNVTSVTWLSNGNYEINFTKQYSAKPICVPIAFIQGSGATYMSQDMAASTFSKARLSGGGNSVVTAACFGFR